jgi:hypothetical protein
MTSTDTSPTLTVTSHVEYLYPGAITAEIGSNRVTERDPQRAADHAAPGAYAFTFYDVASVVMEVNGERITLKSGRINESARYLIDGEVFDAEGVAALEGNFTILLDNMRANGWQSVVRFRSGGFQPLRPTDMLISRT